jgi:hypothetical protein
MRVFPPLEKGRTSPNLEGSVRTTYKFNYRNSLCPYFCIDSISISLLSLSPSRPSCFLCRFNLPFLPLLYPPPLPDCLSPPPPPSSLLPHSSVSPSLSILCKSLGFCSSNQSETYSEYCCSGEQTAWLINSIIIIITYTIIGRNWLASYR